MPRPEWWTMKSRTIRGARGAIRFRARTMRLAGLLLVALVWVGGAVTAQAKLDYKVYPIDYCSTSNADTSPYELLNNNCDLTGRWRVNNESHGFVHFKNDMTITDLGARVIPVKISNQRVVGGTKETYNGQTFVRSDVCRWNAAGGMKILDNLGGNSHAYRMNENGAIVGFSFSASPVKYFGCLWEPGKPVVALAEGITPTAINLAKQVVVKVEAHNQAALLEGTTYTYLGLLPGGIQNWARAINESGQVVGTCVDGSNYLGYGFIWDKVNKLKPLDPTGSHPSDPWAINNKSQVVGTATDTTTGRKWGFFWTKETGLVELNECIDRIIDAGWDLRYAYGINDNGDIVGVGIYKGQSRAFFLTPSNPGSETMASVLTLLLFSGY